jgi:hypothetical protein
VTEKQKDVLQALLANECGASLTQGNVCRYGDGPE